MRLPILATCEWDRSSPYARGLRMAVLLGHGRVVPPGFAGTPAHSGTTRAVDAGGPHRTFANAGGTFLRLDGTAFAAPRGRSYTSVVRLVTGVDTYQEVLRKGAATYSVAEAFSNSVRLSADGTGGGFSGQVADAGGANFTLFAMGSANTLNLRRTFASSFQYSTQTNKLYADGRLYATNTDSAHDYNSAGAVGGPLYVGSNTVDGATYNDRFRGKMYWLLIYDWCLPVGMIAKLSHCQRWDFLEPDEPLADIQTTFTSNSTSLGLLSSAGTYDFTSDALAGGDAGGIGTTEPSSGTIFSFSSGSTSTSEDQLGIPELRSYEDYASITGELESFSPYSFESASLAGGRLRSALNGRADLIGTGSYRR